MNDDLATRLRAAGKWLRAGLVGDLRRVWRQWSTWLLALGSGFVTFIQLFPHEALDLWNSLPADLRGRVPDKVALAITSAIVVGAFLAKHVAQRKGGTDA